MSRFKVGDRVIFIKNITDFDKELLGAIGTIKQIYRQFSGDIAIKCGDWTIPFQGSAEWEADSDEFELAQPYLQKEEAKKLLGIK